MTQDTSISEPKGSKSCGKQLETNETAFEAWRAGWNVAGGASPRKRRLKHGKPGQGGADFRANSGYNSEQQILRRHRLLLPRAQQPRLGRHRLRTLVKLVPITIRAG